MKNFHVFFFCFKQLQMLVDEAWEKDNIKTTECVCAHVHLFCSHLTDSGNRWTSGVTVLLTAVLPVHSSSFDGMFYLQALNIHCNNVCFYFVQIINTIYQKNVFNISFNNVYLFFVQIVTTIFQQTLNI